MRVPFEISRSTVADGFALPGVDAEVPILDPDGSRYADIFGLKVKMKLMKSMKSKLM